MPVPTVAGAILGANALKAISGIGIAVAAIVWVADQAEVEWSAGSIMSAGGITDASLGAKLAASGRSARLPRASLLDCGSGDGANAYGRHEYHSGEGEIDQRGLIVPSLTRGNRALGTPWRAEASARHAQRWPTMDPGSDNPDDTPA